jgi:hypothetical protein
VNDYNLKTQSWDQVLESVEGISAGATKSQMKSLMTVPAKAAMEIGEDLRKASEEIHKFNDSTGRLTKVLIWLNVALVLTATLQVIAAFVRK